MSGVVDRRRLALVLIAAGAVISLGHAVHLLIGGRAGGVPVVFTGQAGRWTVRGTATPVGQASLRVEVLVLDAAGAAPTALTPVWATLTMSAHPMVPVEITLAQTGAGSYAGSTTLPMAGRWRVTVHLAGHTFSGNVVAGPAIDRPNPVAATPQSLALGERLYRRECEACHGVIGAGDGPLAANLRPGPVDLRIHAAGAHTDGQLFYFISEGFRGSAMPAFKTRLSEDERWHVVNFIRTFALVDR